MKIVIAVIKPYKLDEVQKALTTLGFTDLMTTEVKAFRPDGHREIFRGSEYLVNFLPKVEVTVAVQDQKVDDVVQVILKAARTGKQGTAGSRSSVPSSFGTSEPARTRPKLQMARLSSKLSNEAVTSRRFDA